MPTTFIMTLVTLWPRIPDQKTVLFFLNPVDNVDLVVPRPHCGGGFDEIYNVICFYGNLGLDG